MVLAKTQNLSLFRRMKYNNTSQSGKLPLLVILWEMVRHSLISNILLIENRAKGLLETQKVDEDLFLFRFQAETHIQEILELSALPFANCMIYLWP